VDDFYREAWRTYTDGRDNLFPTRDRLESHRDAIDRWVERVESLLWESQIATENVAAVREGLPQIVTYGLGRLAQMDTLAMAVSDLEDLNNLDRTAGNQRNRVDGLKVTIEELSIELSENGPFSSFFDGFPVILFVMLTGLLWIWVSGVAVEALMLVVGINRDIRSIRNRVAIPPAQGE
jgi:hypothetical protein